MLCYSVAIRGYAAAPPRIAYPLLRVAWPFLCYALLRFALQSHRVVFRCFAIPPLRTATPCLSVAIRCNSIALCFVSVPFLSAANPCLTYPCPRSALPSLCRSAQGRSLLCQRSSSLICALPTLFFASLRKAVPKLSSAVPGHFNACLSRRLAWLRNAIPLLFSALQSDAIAMRGLSMLRFAFASLIVAIPMHFRSRLI